MDTSQALSAPQFPQPQNEAKTRTLLLENEKRRPSHSARHVANHRGGPLTWLQKCPPGKGQKKSPLETSRGRHSASSVRMPSTHQRTLADRQTSLLYEPRQGPQYQDRCDCDCQPPKCALAHASTPHCHQPSPRFRSASHRGGAGRGWRKRQRPRQPRRR